MALPPLELFSLRKELPCCRAALSASEAVFVAVRHLTLRIPSWIAPLAATGLAKPRVDGVCTFQNGVGLAAFGAGGHFVRRRSLFRVFDDVLRDGLCGDGARFLQLISADYDAREHDGPTATRILCPGIDARAAQSLSQLPC